jgi:urease accessory protein
MFTNLINRVPGEGRVFFNLIGCPAILAAAFFLGAETASAREIMGGSTPLTFAEGLFSGVGHPLIGPDYLAFLLALGIAVGVFRLSFINPLLFVIAMICGVAMHVAGLYLPAADLIVSVSVLIAGLMLTVRSRSPLSPR